MVINQSAAHQASFAPQALLILAWFRKGIFQPLKVVLRSQGLVKNSAQPDLSVSMVCLKTVHMAPTQCQGRHLARLANGAASEILLRLQNYAPVLVPQAIFAHEEQARP